MKQMTTGQMIDNLGLDDTAINQDGYRVGFDPKGNLLVWSKNEEKPINSESNQFGIYYPHKKDDRWTINYCYVTFEEAMSALYVHNEEVNYEIRPNKVDYFQTFFKDNISLDILAKGKWMIRY